MNDIYEVTVPEMDKILSCINQIIESIIECQYRLEQIGSMDAERWNEMNAFVKSMETVKEEFAIIK